MNEEERYESMLGALARGQRAVQAQRREEERQRLRRREVRQHVEDLRRAKQSDREDGDLGLLDQEDYGHPAYRRGEHR